MVPRKRANNHCKQWISSVFLEALHCRCPLREVNTTQDIVASLIMLSFEDGVWGLVVKKCLLCTSRHEAPLPHPLLTQ